MDYQKLYNILIQNNPPRSGYEESHHIIPRCMGGTDESSNLVKVSARVHFILHWILCKQYPKNRALTYAFNAMCRNDKNQLERKQNSKHYKYARERFSSTHPLNDPIVRLKHKTACNNTNSLHKQRFTRFNSKLYLLNQQGIYPFSELFDGYFSMDYNKQIKFKNGQPADPTLYKIRSDGKLSKKTNWITNLSQEDLNDYKRHQSARLTHYISNLSDSAKTQRHIRSLRTRDNVKVGIAISKAKKNKSTNQQEIMGTRFAYMTDAIFTKHISKMRLNKQNEFIKLRNAWKHILNLNFPLENC